MEEILNAIQAIADGICTLFDFIFTLIDFVISLIKGFFTLLSMLPDALLTTSSVLAYAPAFISAGIVVTISIYMVKTIIGR